MTVGDPDEVLFSYGLPMDAAHRVGAVLTEQVTVTMRALLPGVEHSPASQGLWLISVPLQRMLPVAAQTLIAGLDHHRAAVAAFPVVLLSPIMAELNRWRTATGTAVSVPAQPGPAQALVTARYEAAGQITRVWAQAAVPGQVTKLSMTVRALVRDHCGPGPGRQWTGWALLAALSAMDVHHAALLLPPPAPLSLVAHQAEGAVQVGWALALTAALTLIADGEQEATAQTAPPADQIAPSA